MPSTSASATVWTLQLRVGLNSGQVIAGEIGSKALGYTAIGEQVGMAQRMESVAPPGGVMLSESTARLVAQAAVLADAEQVHIKGSDVPVLARRLLSLTGGPQRSRRLARRIGRARAGSDNDRRPPGSIEERARMCGLCCRACRASARRDSLVRPSRWRCVKASRWFQPSVSRTPASPLCRGGGAAARGAPNYRTRRRGGAGTGACQDPRRAR